MKTILAIDPGTSCGWARASETAQGHLERTDSGAWRLLTTGEPEHLRPTRLADHIRNIHRITPLDALYIEDVPAAAHVAGRAAHVHGIILGAIQTTAADLHIPVVPVSPSTYKRSVVGLARAGKEHLRAFAVHRWGGATCDPISDQDSQDRIDACVLLQWAIEREATQMAP